MKDTEHWRDVLAPTACATAKAFARRAIHGDVKSIARESRIIHRITSGNTILRLVGGIDTEPAEARSGPLSLFAHRSGKRA